MTTLSETAKAYVAPKTQNIADLQKCSVHEDMHTKTGKTAEGEEFTYKYVVVNDTEYRVPASVIKQIKTLIEEMGADFEWFKVKKSGSGLGTEYTVIPVKG